MMRKKGGPTGVNAGEALLQRLTISAKQEPVSADNGEGDGTKTNKMFRTMESLEAEMMTPQKKGTEGEKKKEETTAEDTKEVAAEETASMGKSKDNEATTQKLGQSNFEYRDPIMELMNPGGHLGGYGMPMQQQQQQQPQTGGRANLNNLRAQLMSTLQKQRKGN
mmetsp:Transcript_17527/g.37941  ORF Transcript_17527/g.37941 Transcript_17527/m.37941 type:complete len:165 (+) Transcript_17527:1492-1986(+)